MDAAFQMMPNFITHSRHFYFLAALYKERRQNRSSTPRSGRTVFAGGSKDRWENVLDIQNEPDGKETVLPGLVSRAVERAVVL